MVPLPLLISPCLGGLHDQRWLKAKHPDNSMSFGSSSSGIRGIRPDLGGPSTPTHQEPHHPRRYCFPSSQGPIEIWLPKQVEVTEWGQLDYEKNERSHDASMQPLVEHLVEECRREYREMKGELG